MSSFWNKICGKYVLQPDVTKHMKIINELEKNKLSKVEYDYCKRYTFDANNIDMNYLKEITDSRRVYYKFIGDTLYLTVCPLPSV